MVEFKQDSIIDLEPAKDIINTLEKLFRDKHEVWGITKFGSLSTVTTEGREYFAQADFTIEKTKAMAVILSSLSQRLIFNVYVKMNKPVVEHKAFSTIKAAEKWFDRLSQVRNGA